MAHDEISPDAYHADLRHEPDPSRSAERERLGLLGRLAGVLCLIEIFSDTPDEREVMACLGKLIGFRQRLLREALKQKNRMPKKRRSTPKRRAPRAAPQVDPVVWIMTSRPPTAVLVKGAFGSARGWPVGVYLSPELYRVGIVVTCELPRERSTLLVRVMAAGPPLVQAVKELSELPDDAPERAVTEEPLLSLEHVLGRKPRRTPEEQEFIMSVQSIREKLVEKARAEGRNEGRAEGRNEGRQLQARAALRSVLTGRKLVASPAEEARIDACDDVATLERWHGQALVAKSAAEALRGDAAERAGTRRRRAARVA